MNPRSHDSPHALPSNSSYKHASGELLLCAPEHKVSAYT
jgi:hypothetical protein